MEAKLETLHKFFNKQSTQFFIPVYQREYSWNLENIKKLLEDYENILNNESDNHFIGNVIYKSSTNGGMVKNEIIDGQQRITTMFLFLISFKNNLENQNSTEKENISKTLKIIEQYMLNLYCDDELKMRFKPNNDDKKIFKNIYENKITKNHFNLEKKLVKNYLIIYDKIKEWLSIYTINNIINLFHKVSLVSIEIVEKDDFKVQKVFESINSTGLNLENIDLIRNYLLMGLDEKDQEIFFANKWLVFEEYFKRYLGTSDEFLKMFLQSQKYKFISKKNIYKEFKELVKTENENSDKTISKMIDTIKNWISLYLEKNNNIFEYERVWQDDPKNNKLQSSLLIISKNAYDNSKIDLEQFKNIKNYISIYIIRRKIADLDSSPITRLFTDSLLSGVKKSLNSKNIYLDRYIYEELFKNKQETEMRCPSDKELFDILKHKNIYSLGICKQILLFLENWENKVVINPEKFEIEHIAPQKPKLNSKWYDWFGKNDYFNRINFLGNLTLVTDSMNKELSNN